MCLLCFIAAVILIVLTITITTVTINTLFIVPQKSSIKQIQGPVFSIMYGLGFRGFRVYG